MSIYKLKELLAERSVRRGKFILASGKVSSVYVDARLTTMSPDGMVLIGKLGLESLALNHWGCDSIGGLTLGADPVAYAISHTSIELPKPLRAFTVRKEPKAHGTGRVIEGPFRNGDQVVVVEDVITTGSSALQAVAAVQKEGGIITGVLAVIDREEGGREAIQAAGFEVSALISLSSLLS